MPSIRLSRVVVAVVALLSAACGDPTKPKATYVNASSSYALHALTGAPAYGATAISILGGATHADARYTFDLAFDLNSSGQTLVYPVRVLGGPLAQLVMGSAYGTSLARVGMQKIPGSFDAITEVPNANYDTLTVQAIRPGEVLAVEVLESSCYYSLGGQTLSAKLTVDSVNVPLGRIYARTVVDANCGYRGVVADSLPGN